MESGCSLAPEGQLEVFVGPGYQGHEGQFLAVLAQCRVKSDFQLRVDGHELSIQDLIEYEKRTCQPNSELTFKLIGLSHYLPVDASWNSQEGEEWSIPRLIEEELAQPVVGAACGGTHRMMGFSYAVRKRERSGQSVDGQWLRARKYVNSYLDYIKKLQNEDGSLSTNWFEGRGDWGDLDTRLRTTGHLLEWLVFSLPDDELQADWVTRSVNYLARLLLDNYGRDWEIGPLGHGLHALAIYDERVYGRKPGQRELVQTDKSLLDRLQRFEAAHRPSIGPPDNQPRNAVRRRRLRRPLSGSRLPPPRPLLWSEKSRTMLRRRPRCSSGEAGWVQVYAKRPLGLSVCTCTITTCGSKPGHFFIGERWALSLRLCPAVRRSPASGASARAGSRELVMTLRRPSSALSA